LVKIADESMIPRFVPLKAAKQGPVPGDEIYVIGTPLDLSLSETITKGIVSAERIIDGQPYLQTDAAINPGNSRGPAFDANGELVAIAVAGIFTSSGASVNINYLIPIDEAMKSLNIVALD
jgi:serine protease Do